MAAKSTARPRRSKQESTRGAASAERAKRATKRAPAKAAEQRAAGEIMRALLNAITFGALEPAPPSRAS